jgi:hypothetical protein
VGSRREFADIDDSAGEAVSGVDQLTMMQWGVATDENTVYVAVSDLKLNAVEPGFPGAQTSRFNPKVAFLLDDKVGGGLHALNIETGEEIWQTPHPGCNDVPGCSPAQSAAVGRPPPDGAGPTSIADGRFGAAGHVPAVKAERPLSVQSGDVEVTRGKGRDAPKAVIRAIAIELANSSTAVGDHAMDRSSPACLLATSRSMKKL